MPTSISKPTSDLREWRRLRAWELARQGWRQRDIATALGVTEGAVSQWLKRAREGGPESLRRRIAPGPPHRLSAEQRGRLPMLLARGAEAYGFRGAVWTARRIAIVIQQEFGVRYHPSHVNRLVRALGLSVQVPEVRAAQRDPTKVAAWFADHWPALEKKPATKRARSSESTNPASTFCPPGSAPTRPKARPRS
jgi:transposase